MKIFRKTIIILILLAFSLSLNQGYAEQIQVGSTNGLRVALKSSTPHEVVIEYEMGSFETKSVTIDGSSFQKLALKKEAWILQKGAPELPKITRSIAIPNDAKVEVIVDIAEYIDLPMSVAPSKGIVMRSNNIDAIPYTFSDVYSSDSFFPAQQATLGNPYLLRDIRGITIDVFPFAYNPVFEILRVYTKLVVRITKVGRNTLNNSIFGDSSSVSPHFKEIYENHFINFSSRQVMSAVGEKGRMIVICHDAFCDAVQPYVDWKIRKGIPTTKVAISTIGNSSTAIKNYIQTEYNKNDGLTFVQLVGDASHVSPYYEGTIAQDPTYSLLAGNDSYPDIFVGRFSADSVADVQTQVARTIYHERDMPVASWQKKAVGIASNEGAGAGDDGEADWQHMRNIRTDLLGYNFTTVDELYDGSQGGADTAGHPSAQDVKTAIETGRSLINYTGHGNRTSFKTTKFSTTDVNNLQNVNKLPLVVAVACLVGKFQTKTSFSEAWLRATDNSGNATGAIGFYGATVLQSWQPPMSAQDEIVDLFVAKKYKTVGGLLYNGSIKMINEYGSRGEYMFKTWHIFGDASLTFETSGAQNSFVVNYTHSTDGLKVQFSDKSTVTGAKVTNWYWDFGDGSNSRVQNPHHTYASSGTYQVTLLIWDSNSNISTKTESITVNLTTGQSYR